MYMMRLVGRVKPSRVVLAAVAVLVLIGYLVVPRSFKRAPEDGPVSGGVYEWGGLCAFCGAVRPLCFHFAIVGLFNKTKLMKPEKERVYCGAPCITESGLAVIVVKIKVIVIVCTCTYMYLYLATCLQSTGYAALHMLQDTSNCGALIINFVCLSQLCV